MTPRSKGERGVALVLAALFLTAIIAISGIAVEVSRLTDTATEVQVAADAAALAAAENKVKGGTDDDAKAAARTVAANNATDGRAPASGDVGIEFGSYSVANGFSSAPPTGTDKPAVRATVAISNVRYLLATVFGAGSSTTVTKRAVATFALTGQTQPNAPLAVCDCSLQQQCQPCSSGNLLTATAYTQAPTTTQNSCLLASNSNDAPWFNECPGVGQGTGAPPLISAGGSVNLDNGQVSPVLRDLSSCVDAGVHDYVIPVIHCPSSPTCAIGNCTGAGQVVGFATINIVNTSAIVSSGSPKSVTFSQICNSAAPGTGGDTSGGCFGSGNVMLVDDRG